MEDWNVAIDLKKAGQNLVAIPLIWLGVIFIAGLTAKPWVIETFGLVTTAQADDDKRQILKKVEELDKRVGVVAKTQMDHIKEFRIANAYALVRSTMEDMQEHDDRRNDTREWEREAEVLRHRVELAEEYKECVIHDRPDCQLIQRELWN